MTPPTQVHRPDIITSDLPGWVGVAVLFPLFFWLRQQSWTVAAKASLLLGILFVVMGSVELWFCRKNGKGWFAYSPRPFQPLRLAYRTLGWLITLAGVATPYWLFPEYAGTFYQPFYAALAISWPYLAVFATGCLLWEDRFLDETTDAYYHIGRAAWTLSLPSINLKQHLLGWIIKAYFLPLMFVYLTGQFGNVFQLSGIMGWYDSVYNLVFLIDTAFVSVGYLFANRLLDTQVRSAEPTMYGWTVALLCYQPFWSSIGGPFIKYGSAWSDWIHNPVYQVLWVLAILSCEFVYIWATIAFGTRFSNLTHRGILACGPYAYLQHPAYTAKLGSFLLISVPFFGNDVLTVIRSCVLWGLLCGIYYCRAKTEEANLRSTGPDYDTYVAIVRANRSKLWQRLFN